MCNCVISSIVVYDTWADYTDLMWRFCCTESNYYPVVYEQLLRV